MAFLFDHLLMDLAAVFTAVIVLIVTYYKRSYSYWKDKGIPYLEPKIPFGNTQNPFTRTKTLGLIIKGYYDQFKARSVKHGGIYVFTSPIYMPVEPEYVKNIMAKDFQYFVDRGVYYNEKDDPLSAHLFAIGGTKWRNLRTKLTPTFTSGKMKMMFPTLVECSKQLGMIMEKNHEKGRGVDIKEVLGCFTTDIIGSCAFGLECNSFNDPDAPFRKYGKKVFQSSRWRNLKLAFSFSFPELSRKLGIKVIPTDISDFFMKAVKDTVEYREKNNYTRNDFLQLLIDLKDGAEKADQGEYKHDGKILTVEEMAAQAFVFFLAGFETSSTTMTFCLYELAQNQEIQQKVRDEVSVVLKKHEGKITYEAIMEMKYMGQVLEETLRKYPPVPSLNRKCIKDYKIPDQDIVLEKGTSVSISVLGLHYDKDHFEDPEKFDPERFSDENKKMIRPYTYLPFGEGPRICIGLRFGVMQSKVGLAVLLRDYKFRLNTRTCQPLVMDPKSFVLSTEGGIWLDVEKLN